MIWSSGDSAWQEGEAYVPFDNLGNVTGRMYYGKFIAGCAAGLTTKTGSIAPRSTDQRTQTCGFVLTRGVGRQDPPGELPGRDGSSRLHGQLDRILVQYPRLHARPHPQVANGFLDGGTISGY